MRYVLSTAPQLFTMALLTGLIASVGPIAYMIHRDMKLLPVVTLTKEGQCVKVTNYENGHAFFVDIGS